MSHLNRPDSSATVAQSNNEIQSVGVPTTNTGTSGSPPDHAKSSRAISGLSVFTAEEKRNILLYTIGIMCYKFALESYIGTIKALALERLTVNTFMYTGYLDGFNQAAQCIGSIIVAPLVRHFHTKTVLSVAVITFALISSLGMIIEAATGGKVPQQRVTGKALAGNWDAKGVIPIFVFAGITHGMVELIRRIIPRDIVGGNVSKLRKMDSIVHIFYEVSGTAGAFFATFIALTLGKAFAPVVSPFLFLAAAVFWWQIKVARTDDIEGAKLSSVEEPVHRGGLIAGIVEAFTSFGVAIYEGARIVLSSRKFAWLILGYSVPLVLHRYLENGLASNYAKIKLNESAYGPIMVGGSNFGELCGAAFVFFFTNLVKTPLPWLRLDAVTLSIAWIFYGVSPQSLGTSPIATAWVIAAVLIPISMGWAAGDVSLAAFIQSHVSRLKHTNPHVSSLGAVMAFLYVLYIVIYAIISPVIGGWLDRLPKDNKNEYFKYIGGVMFTILGVIIFAATLTPKGAFALNPEILDEYGHGDEDEEDEDVDVGGKMKEKEMTEMIAG
ncbi:hypothetical protein HK097_002977 [Rhizophlyctis rosea]|uniref:Uncharacterized protein n=1 Tax=Rhizophlyctis rosea TaxID=64517 RepID=A0AAD5X7L5_9FUNG|nr:hypothetical protein HK097_002977 [Rhizophlyctis rosea]